eukprot:4872699-Pyramimonas_sp.AAC.1
MTPSTIPDPLFTQHPHSWIYQYAQNHTRRTASQPATSLGNSLRASERARTRTQSKLFLLELLALGIQRDTHNGQFKPAGLTLSGRARRAA